MATALDSTPGCQQIKYLIGLSNSPAIQPVRCRHTGNIRPRQANIVFLRVLRLAENTFESDLTAALELLVNRSQRWDEIDVEQFLEPEPVAVPQLSRGAVELGQYDQLLVAFSHEPA